MDTFLQVLLGFVAIPILAGFAGVPLSAPFLFFQFRLTERAAERGDRELMERAQALRLWLAPAQGMGVFAVTYLATRYLGRFTGLDVELAAILTATVGYAMNDVSRGEPWHLLCDQAGLWSGWFAGLP